MNSTSETIGNDIRCTDGRNILRGTFVRASLALLIFFSLLLQTQADPIFLSSAQAKDSGNRLAKLMKANRLPVGDWIPISSKKKPTPTRTTKTTKTTKKTTKSTKKTSSSFNPRVRPNAAALLTLHSTTSKVKTTQDSMQISGQIQGGWAASADSFPWMGSMRSWWNSGWNWHFCGGSFIRSDLFLTAAHCVYGSTIVDFRVWARAYNISQKPGTGDVNSIQMKPVKIFMNPNYIVNQCSWDCTDWDPGDDIAIIQMTPEINPFNLSVVTIDYNTNPYAYLTGDSATSTGDNSALLMSGWGKLCADSSSACSVPPIKQMAWMPWTPNRQPLSGYSCQDIWGFSEGGREGINDKDICIGGSYNATCSGDSGSSVFIPAAVSPTGKDLAIGLTSYGAYDGSNNCGAYPGIFTRIGSYADFISGVAFSVDNPNVTSTATLSTVTVTSVVTSTLLSTLIQPTTIVSLSTSSVVSLQPTTVVSLSVSTVIQPTIIVSLSTVLSLSTLTNFQPTTLVSLSTILSVSTLTNVQPTTVISVSTIPGSTVTLPASTITQAITTIVSTSILFVSSATLTVSGPTVSGPTVFVTSTVASPITIVSLNTLLSTVLSTLTLPTTQSIMGPTITHTLVATSIVVSVSTKSATVTSTSFVTLTPNISRETLFSTQTVMSTQVQTLVSVLTSFVAQATTVSVGTTLTVSSFLTVAQPTTLMVTVPQLITVMVPTTLTVAQSTTLAQPITLMVPTTLTVAQPTTLTVAEPRTLTVVEVTTLMVTVAQPTTLMVTVAQPTTETVVVVSTSERVVIQAFTQSAKTVTVITCKSTTKTTSTKKTSSTKKSTSSTRKSTTTSRRTTTKAR
jgi:hypothetical protein